MAAMDLPRVQRLLAGGPALAVVNGNFVLARRRGIVGGVDFGLAGHVRRVLGGPLRAQLDAGCLVLLTNVGVSTGGELLNCSVYDVAVHAAVELGVDKLICATGADVRELDLPAYLPLPEAEKRILQAGLGESGGGKQDPRGNSRDDFLGPLDAPLASSDSEDWSDGDGEAQGASSSVSLEPLPSSLPSSPLFLSSPPQFTTPPFSTHPAPPAFPSTPLASPEPGTPLAASLARPDLDRWQDLACPPALAAAVVACRLGVARAHLVDAALDGGLLLELYTRDGVAGVCMVAADLYQGMRPALVGDLPGVERLLGALPGSGRFPAAGRELRRRMEALTVLAREGGVLGVAAVRKLGAAPDGRPVEEVAALTVDARHRRAGLGDALLDFVEQAARARGARRLLAVQGSDGDFEWLRARGFEPLDDEALPSALPRDKLRELSAAAAVYAKGLLPLEQPAEPGSRIGF